MRQRLRRLGREDMKGAGVMEDFVKAFRKEFDGPPLLAMGVKFREDGSMLVGSLWLPVVEGEMTDEEGRELHDSLSEGGMVLTAVVLRLLREWGVEGA